MSTQNRTGGGGGRNQKKSNPGGGGGDASTKKVEVPKTEKEKIQLKPTAEQMRIAEITDVSGSEDPKMREKVQQLIELTHRSEEEVCCALNECDNNLDRAVVFLLETLPVGAFETSSKKKKNRAANASSDNNADGEWTDNNVNSNDKRERSRNRTNNNNRNGRGGADSRGWRGREARENEKNAADSKGGEVWRGRGRGSSRGGYGGRGGRGGRLGPRSIGTRDQGRTYSRSQQETHEVDTWDNTLAQTAESAKQDDVWGDWDNEEYNGSLKDTKVFTPSNLQNQGIPGAPDIPAPPGLEHTITNQQSHISSEELVPQYSAAVVSSTVTMSGGSGVNAVQFPDIHSANASQHLRLNMESQQLKSASALSAEQSQYFNSLPSQGGNQQPNVNSYQNSSVQYTSYVSGNVFGDQVASSKPAVRRARAKVPPPSKIPSSAVEMPGDSLNNSGYLDLQFGGLDFGTEESFDALTEKFNTTSIESQQNVQSQDVNSNDYQTKTSAQQSALSAGLQTSQISDNIQSSYSQRASGNLSQQTNSGVGSAINSAAAAAVGTNSALDQLGKNDPYSQSTNVPSAAAYQSSYSSNTAANKSTYQSTGPTQGYNNTNYTSTQASSGTSYQQPSNSSYTSYNQSSVSSYQQATAANSVSNSVAGAVANNTSSTQNIPVGGSNNAVNSATSNTSTGYLSGQYQSNQSSSAFQSQQSAYQNNPSVYGNTGLPNNTGYSSSTNTASSQYSNFSSSKLKETPASASSHFDSVSNVTSNNAVSNTSVSSSAVTTMSSPSLGLTNTKVTNSTAKSNTGMVPNIQMVSPFIQTPGMPYYQQPVYSYEDLQMMQQRMPHVTQYYDINYPPTSLGAAGVREANLGSVAYSTMTDGRFTRTDNNSSPVSNVSSTMSQQAGSSGPMLNVPYAYFYGGNMMPGGFQYGTPALYPQQMPAANATSGGQFPKPSYNSGYGSASYDTLGQTTQDYSKGTYTGSGVNQQNKTQNVSNTPQTGSASDIASSMYGKSHVALNKVNSYEKQSFHSGTPPPFNLTGTQTAGATSAQPYGMYIQPMPAAHHNINIHQPILQESSNSSGQRQQTSSQSKSGTKQGYSPSYWTAQN